MIDGDGHEITRDLVIAAVKKDDVGWLDDGALRGMTKLVYRADEPVEGRWVPVNKVSGFVVEGGFPLFLYSSCGMHWRSVANVDWASN